MLNDEMKLEEAVNNPNFLCQSGSRLYGTSTPSSDEDFRGFVIPPFPYLIHVKEFVSKDIGEDSKVYSLESFLKLALKGDPQVTELFFAPKDFHSKRDEIGDIILSMREKIVSNAIFGRILGYGAAEWRKAMAIKIVSKDKPKEKSDLINEIRNLYHPDKEMMDDIIRILDSMDEKEIVSSMSGMGVKRRKDIEEYGICRKSAAHAIRLVSQLIEIMETGYISFPRQNAKLLLDIRNGLYQKEELNEMYHDLVSKAEESRNKSVLPDRPDSKYVWNKYSEIILSNIKKECF